MRINRGCGCLLLVLASLNLLFVLAAVIGLAGGNISVQLGMLALALFGANLVASFMLGLAGFRGRPVGAGGGTSELDAAAIEEEGEVVDRDSSE